MNSGIGEQLPRNFILHVQAIVTPQIATESIPQRAEEPLTRTKDCRDYIGRYVTAAYSLKIVVPEFVLYEHHHLWLCGIKECFYIAGSVERQVCRSHPRVEVVAHGISRRGKECEQNPAPGIRREQTLDERSALLEFSKRCGMYPQSISSLGATGLHARYTVAVPANHQRRFTGTHGDNPCGSGISSYDCIIYQAHRQDGCNPHPHGFCAGSRRVRGDRWFQTYADLCIRLQRWGGKRSSHFPCEVRYSLSIPSLPARALSRKSRAVTRAVRPGVS